MSMEIMFKNVKRQRFLVCIKIIIFLLKRYMFFIKIINTIRKHFFFCRECMNGFTTKKSFLKHKRVCQENQPLFMKLPRHPTIKYKKNFQNLPLFSRICSYSEQKSEKNREIKVENAKNKHHRKLVSFCYYINSKFRTNSSIWLSSIIWK